MSIAKNGARRIVIDGVDYLWRIKPESKAQLEGASMTLTVEAVTSGSVLIVDLMVRHGEIVVTPSVVVDIVRRAIRHGSTAHEIPASKAEQPARRGATPTRQTSSSPPPTGINEMIGFVELGRCEVLR